MSDMNFDIEGLEELAGSDSDTDTGDDLIMVVSVRTSYWKSGNVLRTTKEVRLLRRLSNYDYVLTDAECAGVQEVIESIENLYEVPDGRYELVMQIHAGYSMWHVEEDAECTYSLKPLNGNGGGA